MLADRFFRGGIVAVFTVPDRDELADGSAGLESPLAILVICNSGIILVFAVPDGDELADGSASLQMGVRELGCSGGQI